MILNVQILILAKFQMQPLINILGTELLVYLDSNYLFTVWNKFFKG